MVNIYKKSVLPQGIVVIAAGHSNKKFNVEVAKTNATREYGLMNRTSLDVDAGMLFIYSDSDIRSFWMKNTLIPLDILWINDDRIVEMATLQPETPQNTPTYTPKNKANYVLELNAGTAKKYNFKIGDEVKIEY